MNSDDYFQVEMDQVPVRVRSPMDCGDRAELLVVVVAEELP